MKKVMKVMVRLLVLMLAVAAFKISASAAGTNASDATNKSFPTIDGKTASTQLGKGKRFKIILVGGGNPLADEYSARGLMAANLGSDIEAMFITNSEYSANDIGNAVEAWAKEKAPGTTTKMDWCYDNSGSLYGLQQAYTAFNPPLVFVAYPVMAYIDANNNVVGVTFGPQSSTNIVANLAKMGITLGGSDPSGNNGNTGNDDGNTDDNGGNTESYDAKSGVYTNETGKYKKSGNEAAYIGTSKDATTVNIPSKVTMNIDGNKVEVPVTSIAANAFAGNTKITSVKMGSNITSIGKNAFAKCTALKSVTIGSNVTKIGEKAFYKCTKLTKIVIPSKVTTIGKSAFEGCSKLSSLTIGKAVKTIGASAFKDCKQLKTITVKTSLLKKLGSKSFKNTNSKAKVTVPKKKLASYKKIFKKAGVASKAKYVGK